MPTRNKLTKRNLRRAEEHLSNVDAVMAQLIGEHGACRIVSRTSDPFHTLVNSIISQQLSSKAAATIKQRISEIVSSPYTPLGFHGVRKDRLRKAGLSNAKTKYILDLARYVKIGQLSFEAFGALEDEAVIEALMKVNGIGRWTAEMFLIFALKRPNVVALSDAGLRRAIKLLYGEDAEFEELSKTWHPYCSVASWYLWQHLDATPTKAKK